MNVAVLMEKQATWQAQQKDKSWEEKLEESLILRETALMFQASNPHFTYNQTHAPTTEQKTKP